MFSKIQQFTFLYILTMSLTTHDCNLGPPKQRTSNSRTGKRLLRFTPEIKCLHAASDWPSDEKKNKRQSSFQLYEPKSFFITFMIQRSLYFRAKRVQDSIIFFHFLGSLLCLGTRKCIYTDNLHWNMAAYC